MAFARKLSSVIVLLLALMTLLFALLYAGQSGDGQTLGHNRALVESFRKAKSFTEAFRSAHHRLPDPAEFNAWSNSFPPVPYESPFGIRMVHKQMPTEAEKACGAPPADFYILEYWRGEWFEYFCPWSEASTLQLSTASLYLFGSKTAEVAAFAVASLLLASIGALLWPKSKRR